jgi:fatty acid desaturase
MVKSRRRPYERYRFSQEIRQKLAPYFQLDNWHGILFVLEDLAVSAVVIGFSLWAWQNLPVIPALLVYLMVIAIVGAKQRGMRVSNHASTHKILASNKILNYFLGTVFSGWLALQSFSAYDYSHNSVSHGHHPNLGTELDDDYMSFVELGLYGEGRTPENVRRYLWSIPLKTPHYFVYLLKYRLWSSNENKYERIARLSYWATLTAGIVYAGWGLELLFYWVVPLFTWANWWGALIELAEHYPMMETSPKVDIYLSRNRLVGSVWKFFIGTHQESYHLVHHLFPGIPFWNFKAAHHILLEDEVYASLQKEKGFRPMLLHIIADQKQG